MQRPARSAVLELRAVSTAPGGPQREEPNHGAPSADQWRLEGQRAVAGPWHVSRRISVRWLLLLSWLLLTSSACGSGSWTRESEPLRGSETLLASDPELEVLLRANTSHTGRVTVFVSLPGVALPATSPEPELDIPMNDFEDGETATELVVAELVLEDARSFVRLPGTGGGLSVRCPGERCDDADSRLLVRIVASADVPDAGVFVEWSALAETFGDGTRIPGDAQATLSERN